MFKKLLKFVLFQTISLCLIQYLHAQKHSSKEQYILNQFSTEHGLSQGNIYQIMKDTDGFLWIVSEDGLNRFDGYTFNVFSHRKEDSTSISDNSVWCVKEDSKGRLWVGTNQGGLCQYKKELDQFVSYQHDANDTSTISDNTVNAILEDSNRKLWIGTSWGVNIFEPTTQTFRRMFANQKVEEEVISYKVYSLLESMNREIWVGTSDGISIYDLDGHLLRSISPGQLGLPKGKVTNMILDKNGTIWISVDGKGLLRYHTSDTHMQLYEADPNDPNSLANNYIRSLLIDQNGNFWIGMDGFGFQIFDPETEVFVKALQNSNFEPDQIEKVYEIYEDDHQNLWFGSYGHGVFLLNSNNSNFKHYTRNYTDKNSLSNNSVLALSEGEDGLIWLGTDGGGINVFDPRNESFRHIRNDGSNDRSIATDVIKSLRFDSGGNLWVGTYNHGLDLLRKGSAKFEHFTISNSGLNNNNVWALEEGHSGEIWIGTLGGGLNKYQTVSGQIEKVEIKLDRDSTLSSVNISALLMDSEGLLWIGTMGYGVNVLDTRTNQSWGYSSTMPGPNQLSHDEIRYFFESSTGEIWIGTAHGLNKFNSESKTFTKYFESDGLPNNAIKGIVEDENGYFWVSTNNGVCRFDPKSGATTNFNQSDGLQGKEFNYNSSIISQEGLIYMGGINGLNQFDPNRVQPNDYQPDILFTKFLLFNRPIRINSDGPLTKEINQIDYLELDYDQFIFSIEFAADEFQFPKKNNYQYKLEGFDPDWNIVGTARTATYTNLPAGNYKFMVKATNNAGVWSDQFRTLDIVVNPPWWHTKSAYTVFLAFAILMVLVIVRLRTSYLLAQKVRLRRLVSKRTKELEEKNERITMQAEELNAFNDSLNELNANLEKTVIERTNELVVKNKKLSDYAFLNAHNLRAPVANIKGLIQLMNLDLTPEEKEDYIQKIKEQVEDVDAVLYDINQRLKKDTLIDDQEIEDILNQSINSSSSSDSSS